MNDAGPKVQAMTLPHPAPEKGRCELCDGTGHIVEIRAHSKRPWWQRWHTEAFWSHCSACRGTGRQPQDERGEG